MTRYSPPVAAPRLDDAQGQERKTGQGDSSWVVAAIVCLMSALLCAAVLLTALQQEGLIHLHLPFLN